ncbi:hypothetical protein EST38_g9588 [Candolleomyces aberdarensis]|uniref:Uncharacterized protein n=1 Tax=Candolleomyces aberdarensis TaxID=2316362 RepID=A0A4Q2DBQ2_9AGAR|nr:hypothetical protein EST38_g9588 [Candolleomyces aberdarensis]
MVKLPVFDEGNDDFCRNHYGGSGGAGGYGGAGASSRDKSLVSHEAEIVYPTSYSTPPPPGYSSQQQQGYSSQQQQYAVQEEDDDAYGGYVVTDDDAYNQRPPAQAPVVQAGGGGSGKSLPNPFDQGSQQGGLPQTGDRRFSDASEYEDEEPKRVLKVANQ